MVQTAQAKDISLETLQDQFDLQKVPYQDFFDEWQEEFPPLSEFEQQQLARVQKNYTNLAEDKPFSEESVKMVVLSPLLDLAEFYQAPFSLLTEESVEIAAEDENTVFRGKIDVLVALQRFWVLVIESKNARFNVLLALPQALAYMLGAPNLEKPAYGLLVNGPEFVFVKLIHHPTPHYARSFPLLIERGELPQVLGALKRIRREILESN
ncbi:MAG: restriction endonuclease subunit R [Phormidesmis sp.]